MRFCSSAIIIIFCLCKHNSPVVFAADVDDLRQRPLVDDGSDVLRVALTQVVQDVAETRGRIRGQVGARVVIGQHHYDLR